MSQNVRFTSDVGQAVYFTCNGVNVYVMENGGSPVYYAGYLNGQGVNVVNPEALPGSLYAEWQRYGR